MQTTPTVTNHRHAKLTVRPGVRQAMGPLCLQAHFQGAMVLEHAAPGVRK